jgi:hypothetical protein
MEASPSSNHLELPPLLRYWTHLVVSGEISVVPRRIQTYLCQRESLFYTERVGSSSLSSPTIDSRGFARSQAKNNPQNWRAFGAQRRVESVTPRPPLSIRWPLSLK